LKRSENVAPLTEQPQPLWLCTNMSLEFLLSCHLLAPLAISLLLMLLATVQQSVKLLYV